ncbi:unnamed protein product, partial [Prorocentrum cordatum]
MAPPAAGGAVRLPTGSSPPQQPHVDSFDEAVTTILDVLGSSAAEAPCVEKAGVAAELRVRRCLERLIRSSEKELQDRQARELCQLQGRLDRAASSWRLRSAMARRALAEEVRQREGAQQALAEALAEARAQRAAAEEQLAACQARAERLEGELRCRQRRPAPDGSEEREQWLASWEADLCAREAVLLLRPAV